MKIMSDEGGGFVENREGNEDPGQRGAGIRRLDLRS